MTGLHPWSDHSIRSGFWKARFRKNRAFFVSEFRVSGRRRSLLRVFDIAGMYCRGGFSRRPGGCDRIRTLNKRAGNGGRCGESRRTRPASRMAAWRHQDNPGNRAKGRFPINCRRRRSVHASPVTRRLAFRSREVVSKAGDRNARKASAGRPTVTSCTDCNPILLCTPGERR